MVKYQCPHCGDILDSKKLWDYNSCKCKKSAIDVADVYVRVIGEMKTLKEDENREETKFEKWLLEEIDKYRKRENFAIRKKQELEDDYQYRHDPFQQSHIVGYSKDIREASLKKRELKEILSKYRELEFKEFEVRWV